jgi:hypothetical protein
MNFESCHHDHYLSAAMHVVVALTHFFQFLLATIMPSNRNDVNSAIHPLNFSEKEVERTYFASRCNDNNPASLPVSNSTRSFWLHPSKDVNPLAKEGSETPIQDKADIVIIGSGISGVGAAYHISKTMPEKKVVILEARDFCTYFTS